MISSVVELARYRPGDVAYWLAFQPNNSAGICLEADQEWMLHCHPKVFYDRKILKTWKPTVRLPRLQEEEFTVVTTILTSKLVVLPFPICEVLRSHNTGEFYYSNANDEWMPEDYLHDTTTAAHREIHRIMQMFKKWADKH